MWVHLTPVQLRATVLAARGVRLAWTDAVCKDLVWLTENTTEFGDFKHFDVWAWAQ